MATLTNADFIDIRQRIQNDPTSRTQFLAWGLSKTQYKAGFQAAETWVVGGFNGVPTTSFKAAIEAAIGQSCTNAQAKLVGYAHSGWRYVANQ